MQGGLLSLCQHQHITSVLANETMKLFYIISFVCVAYQLLDQVDSQFVCSRHQSISLENKQVSISSCNHKQLYMPRTSKDNAATIEYYYCTGCQHKWMYSRTALANAVGHVQGVLKKGKGITSSRKGGCTGASIKAHAYKPSNTRIGGSSLNWQIALDDTHDNHSSHDIHHSPQQSLQGAYQEIQEFPPSPDVAVCSTGRIDPAQLQAGNAPPQQEIHRPRAWTAGDLSTIFEYCRKGLPTKNHASASDTSHLQSTFEELVNCGPQAQKYSDCTTFWTKNDITNAMNCPANITSFGVAREQDLNDFQTNVGASKAEQRFMHFCHEEKLPYTTTRKLYQFILEEKVNHEDFTHPDYQSLHNKLKNHIPDEYKFQMVKLTVGKMYGCDVPVTDANNEHVEVPVRNLWKILCLLFADPRYRGYLDLHPEPVFHEGPNGLERVYNGFASCEFKVP